MRYGPIGLCSLLLGLTVASTSEPPVPFHPHFTKKVEAKISESLTITATHITVTFNKKGAEEMAPGKAWHLGNSHLEFTDAVTVGGAKLEAGKYSLKARKQEGGAWELVLDKPSRFSGRLSDDAVALKTDYTSKSVLFDHLSVDIHPAGDESGAKLYLDVRFDTRLARCEIDLPAARLKGR